MTSPDPTDLRLASTLAEIGRATVLQIAVRAGVSPEEAAVRLLRMAQAGLPLVVGVEGDRGALHGWVHAQQLHPQQRQPTQAAAAQPQAPAAPRQVWSEPAAPPPPAWTSPPTPPLGWRVPKSAGWTAQPPQAATTGATVGDTLSSASLTGELVSLTLVEVVDTADALIAAAGHPLGAGMRAAVVHTEVTAGPAGYQAIPDTCLTLVLTDGTEVHKSSIVLSSRPPFRSGIVAGDTVGGHTVFELDAQAGIAGVRWRASQNGPPLDWRTA